MVSPLRDRHQKIDVLSGLAGLGSDRSNSDYLSRSRIAEFSDGIARTLRRLASFHHRPRAAGAGETGLS